MRASVDKTVYNIGYDRMFYVMEILEQIPIIKKMSNISIKNISWKEDVTLEIVDLHKKNDVKIIPNNNYLVIFVIDDNITYQCYYDINSKKIVLYETYFVMSSYLVKMFYKNNYFFYEIYDYDNKKSVSFISKSEYNQEILIKKMERKNGKKER